MFIHEHGDGFGVQVAQRFSSVLNPQSYGHN
jgi:hypothetical protein